MTIMSAINKSHIITAHKLLAKHVTRTPCVISKPISRIVSTHTKNDVEVFLKHENQQKSGSFKYRGALNKLLSLDDDALKRGLVTYSTGNHGLAMLLATQELSRAKCFNIPLQIVAKKSSALDKLQQLTSRGAKLVFEDTQKMEACKQTASLLATQSNSTLVHPTEQEIIVGQGSVCLEIIEEVPDLDAVIIPCGGGSLLAAASVIFQGTKTHVLAAEPEQGGPQLAESLKRNQRLSQESRRPTIADGLSTSIGENSWRVITGKGSVKGSCVVSESQMVRALKLYYSVYPDVVEPSGIVALAGALFHSSSLRCLSMKDSAIKVAVVLTGGNISMSTINHIITSDTQTKVV
ncbi:tryptophan synthase beta subunit-like PLP-dependent enzyme [Xylariaceae sp. FL0594]|nr:tryptophan synthase beta subunit-like PLP-dependent enzyme [Xylariaceae sp. FL0594]